MPAPRTETSAKQQPFDADGKGGEKGDEAGRWRKFPCKHGLAMMLLFAEEPALFPGADAPDRVREWIASRDRRTEAKEAKAAKEPAAPDEAARKKILVDTPARLYGFV